MAISETTINKPEKLDHYISHQTSYKPTGMFGIN